MAKPYVNAPSRGATLGAFICGLFFADAPKINVLPFIKSIFANFAFSSVIPAPDPAPPESKHCVIPSGHSVWRRPASNRGETVLRWFRYIESPFIHKMTEMTKMTGKTPLARLMNTFALLSENIIMNSTKT